MLGRLHTVAAPASSGSVYRAPSFLTLAVRLSPRFAQKLFAHFLQEEGRKLECWRETVSVITHCAVKAFSAGRESLFDTGLLCPRPLVFRLCRLTFEGGVQLSSRHAFGLLQQLIRVAAVLLNVTSEQSQFADAHPFQLLHRVLPVHPPEKVHPLVTAYGGFIRGAGAPLLQGINDSGVLKVAGHFQLVRKLTKAKVAAPASGKGVLPLAHNLLDHAVTSVMVTTTFPSGLSRGPRVMRRSSICPSSG